ncbi:MAG: hypothetical protein F4X51_16885 [Gemmatimonadetes bacterium]|nr:hypothetical protein [Gemmatimonadota bacterium]
MEEAKAKFFQNHKNWDLSSFRKQQAESIQIIADGPRFNTSLIIYDDGEGQSPEKFEDTFLSLLSGNKNEIHFVQGKYNMGGSGAIVFCGKKRYQLIGSKRYDDTGDFGFTLIREHPLSKEEERTKKNTWYEYLKIDGEIPAFQADQQDLGLYNRRFRTGTIIKLYSYDLPTGRRSVISRDLNQSINEYLFEPILPVITIDKKERYPNDRNLERDLYGLKRRLEQDDSRYVDEYFSEDFDDKIFGKMKVTCYVFKTKLDDRTVKETKETIRREFFKNNMSVLFSVNGQVHGHYTSEFITRSLKLNLLKEHLLIHVDCTNMDYDFRKELFMASRDRLKDGDKTRQLRKFLADKLGSKNSRLTEIQKRRKDSISVGSGDAKEMLKSLTQNLPMNPELMQLLDQTFKLDQRNGRKKKRTKTIKRPHKEPFKSQRFPSYLKLRTKNDGLKPVAQIPLGGEKSIYFETDVEDHYFDRVEDPGEMRIALLGFSSNDSEGGDKPSRIDEIEDAFNVNISSPQEGTIKVNFNPTQKVDVGDAVQIKATLNGAGENFDQIFWVKVSDRQAPQQPSKKDQISQAPDLGLPQCILAYQNLQDGENTITWEKVGISAGEEMDYDTVVYPMMEGEKLERIYINMDSTVLKNFKSKTRNPNEEQLEIANQKYIADVYFHTLFLYTITKNRKYKFIQERDIPDVHVELNEYLKDLFENQYAAFLLNFDTDKIMQLVGD